MGKPKMSQYAKIDTRYHRKRIDIQNHPLVIGLHMAGHRMGLHSRADAGTMMRLYIDRKLQAIAMTYAPCMTVKNGYAVYNRGK